MRASELSSEYLTVAVRGWTGSRKKDGTKRSRSFPIRRMMVIDTETLTDTSQALTFGSAQLVTITWRRLKNGRHVYVDHSSESEVIFHADDLESTDPNGFTILTKHAADSGVPLVSRSVFMERYFRYHCERRKGPNGSILGNVTAVFFNAPFDISRLAEDYGNGRGRNAGSFSFRMWPLHNGSENRFRRRIIVHHLDSKKALVSYGRSLDSSLNELDSGGDDAGSRGQFLDLRQLIWGMTNEATSLERACDLFNLPDEFRKTHPAGHGIITPEYIDYNRQDVTATRELAVAVLSEYMRHPINVQPSKVFSPASLAKAYLRTMGITPMFDRPEFPSDLGVLGNSISTFYGGRAECRIRRTPVPVQVCDFTSMYPTVNILMRLWDHITAAGLDVVDATTEVRAFVETVSVEALLKPSVWPFFVGMAQVIPDGDVLPVRANYANTPGQFNLGLNRLHSAEPLWFTIPDIIAAALLTGKTPNIVRAVRFVSSAAKIPDLRPTQLFGTVRVDPKHQDFFKAVVEQRQAIKQASCKGHPGTCACEACRTCRFLKVLANAGSYGIYVEMIRAELDAKQSFTVYGAHDEPWQSEIKAEEQSQEFCYPPIGATITGAARLMLAILEKLVTDAGGTWLFCDTDSMAIVANEEGSLIPCVGGPHTTADGTECVRALSYQQVYRIRETIDQLNPYDRDKVPTILKVEATCHGFMVSAKRYTLFNHDEYGRPVVPDKIDGKDAYSRHGLGPYLNPIDPESQERYWVQQVWQYLLDSSYGLNPTKPPWFDRPAISRVTVSSPHVMRGLDLLNTDRDYREMVKPFNFVLLTTEGGVKLAIERRPQHRFIAPYTRDPAAWESPDTLWYDVYDPTAEPTPGDEFPFRRMRSVVGEYEVAPEPKFLGPDGNVCNPRTIGLLQRRTVHIEQLIHIGKETNRIEEVANRLYDPSSEVVTEYQREDNSDTIAVINRFTRRKFAALVNSESDRIRERSRTVEGTDSREPSVGYDETQMKGVRGPKRQGERNVYGDPVKVDDKLIQRFVDGANVGPRSHRAIIRTAAKLVAPMVGINPDTIRRGLRPSISPETVLAQWRDAGRPWATEPARLCACGCGRSVGQRSKWANDACRQRHQRKAVSARPPLDLDSITSFDDAMSLVREKYGDVASARDVIGNGMRKRRRGQ